MFLASAGGGDGNGRGPFDDFWYQPFGIPTPAGIRISESTALSLSTLYACVLVLAQTVAVVPVHLYRRLDRGKERATGHPLYNLIHRRPNRWQTSFQWRQMMQWHLGLRHNAYSRILTDRLGRPTELIPMHPDRVRVERIQGADGVMSFRYRYKPPVGEEIVLTRDEVFHVRGLTSDGIEGFSPLEVQSESLGEAVAAQRYSARRMKNDARPGGVIEVQGTFKNNEDRERFRESWQKAQAGINQGKVAVLEGGMTWKDLGVKNTDLQFVELRKLKSYDICAMYRMPPHKVANLERATFSNIEQSSIEFVTDTMMPWFVNWEQELTNQLLTEKEQEEYFVEHLVEGLLRGDSRARAEYYTRLFQVGGLAPNDILERENMNPVPGGDRRFVPANMVPLDKVDEWTERRSTAAEPALPERDEEEERRERDAEAAEAGALVRREVARLGRRSESAADVEAFYGEHAQLIADRLRVAPDVAESYCQMRVASFKVAAATKRTAQWLAAVEARGVHELLEILRAARAH